MNTFFTLLYQFLCGKNSMQENYRQELYHSVGLLTLLIALLIALLFYLGLGRLTNLWQSRSHWVITLLIAATAAFTLAFCLSRSDIGYVDSYMYVFALMNALVVSLYFFIFSMLLKPFSIHAKHIPF